MRHHLRAIKVWELHCLARTVLQLLAQFCEKLKILATGFQLQPLPQSSFSCCCSSYQKPPYTFTAYWVACPLPTPCTCLGYILLVSTFTEDFIGASTCGCSWKNPTGLVTCLYFWGLRLLPVIKAANTLFSYVPVWWISEQIAACLIKQDSCTSSLGLSTLVSPESKTPQRS